MEAESIRFHMQQIQANKCNRQTTVSNRTNNLGDFYETSPLAIQLSKLPPHPCNDVELEISDRRKSRSTLVDRSDAVDGLEGKTVLDLGAGNGIRL